MKKQLLLSAAALTAAAAFAAEPMLPAQAASVDLRTSYESVRADRATDADFKAPMKAPNAQVTFNFPKGTFFVMASDYSFEDGWSGSSYYTTPIWIRPFAEYTYKNTSTLPSVSGQTPSWTWYDLNRQATSADDLYLEQTTQGQELTIGYNAVCYPNGAPVMKLGNYTFGNSYAYYKGQGESKEDWHEITPDLSVTNSISQGWRNIFGYGSGDEYVMPASSGWIGSTFLNMGSTNFDRAAFFRVTGGDEQTGEEWNWFGAGQGNPVDAYALYVPEPAQAYALRGALVACIGSANEDTPLDVRVYEVKAKPYIEEYTDETTGETKKRQIAAELGELLGEGTLTFPKKTGSDEDDYIKMLYAPFQVSDDYGTFDVTLDIQTAIAIVVSGYHDMDEFSMFIHGYQNEVNVNGDGGYAWIGNAVGTTSDAPELTMVSNFFMSGNLYGAPSIYMDMAQPWMVSYWSNPDGSDMKEIEVPVAGGEFTLNTQEGQVPYAIYAANSSENWTITQDTGEELPAWLSVETDDVYETYQGEEEFDGQVNVLINAEPLPAGEEGRYCYVYFSEPGANYLLLVKQGNPKDVRDPVGIEGVENDAIVIGHEYYNLQGQRLSNAPESGFFIVKNLKADGTTSVVKVVK